MVNVSQGAIRSSSSMFLVMYASPTIAFVFPGQKKPQKAVNSREKQQNATIVTMATQPQIFTSCKQTVNLQRNSGKIEKYHFLM